MRVSSGIVVAWIAVGIGMCCSHATAAHTVLVEAESFADRGGWVVDTQSIDQMGSPYVLAHGLGTPVKDATTTVELPAPGKYRVLVRTRDWVAAWNAPGAPGRFQLLVNGRPLKATFGTENAAWHWQDGGHVDVADKRVRLALRDLTGFNGRCDAILLTTDAALALPNADPEMYAWRRRLLGLPDVPPEAGSYDLVVVGGGMAGCCSAVSAARLGVRVALVHNRPVLGGNNSSEVRVGLSGNIHQAPYPRLGDLVDEIGPIGFHNHREALRDPDSPRSRRILEAIQKDPRKKIHNAGPASNYEDGKKLRVVRSEKNLALFLNAHVFRVDRDSTRIKAVVARDTLDGREFRVPGRWFVDCTGDGNLGFLAGADFRVGRESRAETGESLAPEQPDQMTMGTSVQWDSVLEERPSPFPECPWAVQFNEETCQRIARGDWDWEAGIGRNQVTEIEQIRDHALRVTFGNWAYLKNHSSLQERFANRRLAWVAYIGGKRESRRLLGEAILQEQDLVKQKPYPDACVTTTWGIDLHYPDPLNSKHFPGQEFRAIAKATPIKPYAIPFRCLYSRNVPNLMMAGRNISVTHVALGTVRVQRTTGMMGEVVGMGASLCKKHSADPRDVCRKHFAELQELMRRGVGGPAIAQPSPGGSSADSILKAGQIGGGLCVQVGCEDLALPLELARSGRFLVQVLDPDQARIDQARTQLQSQGCYGIVSVDRLKSPAELPYAENLVNLLLVLPGGKPSRPLLAEAFRVLRPGGAVLLAAGPAAEKSLGEAAFQDVSRVAAGDTSWFLGRKPWPTGMGQWTHPRHGADGNTVSGDMLAGPPRRVRWVAGPSRESSRLITGAGRNFYADVLARDAFNGLRLWQRPLAPAGRAVPVVDEDLLFALAGKKLVALEGATGQTVREYDDAGTPGDLLVVDGSLVAVDGRSVRALDVATGRLRWKFEAADPRYVVAGDGAVYLLKGSVRHGESPVAVCLDLATGQVRWQKEDYPWGPKIRRIVYHKGLVVYEISTLRDEKLGNAIHVASAADGRVLWSREFVPGMNHAKQARAMFVGDSLWVLEHRKGVALEPKTGRVKKECLAGHCHCFPPVATPRYLLSGEMELTDLESGLFDANRITKAACSADYGWVPANGLIYVCPKHCVCWPMLRGYAAMAPALTGGEPQKSEATEVVLEKGGDAPDDRQASAAEAWPCYRQNPWRSGSTTAPVPAQLKPLWTANLGSWPEGTIADDWRENPFVRGPVTAPVVAAGKVFVARPDAHQLVALDARTGEIRWRYDANGRIDTPPTIHGGLCLFGSKSGWVYCLRANDGRMVWRLRAAPDEQRIVAYGQVESPWPVPGSILVVDDVAYFAAGRQPLADGGIRVFAVEPQSGRVRWAKRLDSLPIKDFYASCGLEFDNVDLLQQQGEAVVMSRWSFERATGRMTCKPRDAFLAVTMGDSGGVWAPRGCWSYAPRHQPRHKRETPMRGLAVFRDNTLLGCLDDGRTVYRRDFHLDQGEKFDPTWMTGWAAGGNANKGTGDYWLSQRLARQATWSVPAYPETQPKARVVALVLAADRLFAAGSEGGLTVFSATDGRVVGRAPLDQPVWDGMAAAEGRLFVSTQNGDVICLGAE